MGFLIKGDLAADDSLHGTAIGRLFIEERDIKPLYAYLKNGQPIGPDKDLRCIPLQICGEKCTNEDGTVSIRLSVVPDPLYRKKEAQQGAEILAAALSGEILADAMPLFG